MPQRRSSEYYHDRAEELRAVASTLESRDDRSTLLYFANDYDELAEEAAAAEERERPRKRD